MIRKILIRAYMHLVNNSKLTKLTLFTLFAHSLIFVFIIIYNTYFYVENEFNLHTSNEVIEYIFTLFQFNNIGRISIWLWIFLFFWYFVLSPIGECAIVDHLHNNHKMSKSLTFGFHNFHHIAKFDWMVFFFGVIIFLNILSKVFVYELDNAFVLGLLFIWFLMVVFATVLLQYAKTIIIIEWVPVFEAIKQSIGMSLENLSFTIKLVWISFLFNLRLLFNVFFILWIPLAAIFLFQMLGGLWGFADIVVYILFFWLLLFLAYINTLIEWYFRIYRYFAYLTITWNTEHLQKLGLMKNSLGGLFDESDNQSSDDL